MFVCAACGLVYELSLIALGSYLVGSSTTQTSLVISIVLFAMGLGALAAKPLTRRPVESFAAVELSLGVVGALSVPLLYVAFAWLDLYTPALLFAAVLVGALIGAEIPLLMKLVQMVRQQDASEAVADLSAADYVGALAGGLAFPFFLLPVFGLVGGAIITGAVNIVAGALIAGVLFAPALAKWVRVAVRGSTVAALVGLAGLFAVADSIEVTARQVLYDDPILFAQRSQYQEIVLTGAPYLAPGADDVRMYLNGNLQFASPDEYRYHESLVHPAMAGERKRVLVLGGGDGLAVREIRRYSNVESVTLVELDPAVLDVARRDSRVSALNEQSLSDPRVQTITEDAFKWVRAGPDVRGRFDVILVDFPDPDSVDVSKLYSTEFYGMLARLLEPGGRLTAQAGSPFFAPDAFWCVDETIRSAGLQTAPYHVDVPSFGDWGFVMASAASVPAMALDAEVQPQLRFLDNQQLAAATVFPRDRSRRDIKASTLLEPTILEYQRRGWKQQ